MDNDTQRFAAAGAIMLASGVIGLGFGSSVQDQATISKLHGPPLVVLLEVAAYILFGYLVFYGPILFSAAVIASIAAAAWLRRKLGS